MYSIVDGVFLLIILCFCLSLYQPHNHIQLIKAFVRFSTATCVLFIFIYLLLSHFFVPIRCISLLYIAIRMYDVHKAVFYFYFSLCFLDFFCCFLFYLSLLFLFLILLPYKQFQLWTVSKKGISLPLCNFYVVFNLTAWRLLTYLP